MRTYLRACFGRPKALQQTCTNAIESSDLTLLTQCITQGATISTNQVYLACQLGNVGIVKTCLESCTDSISDESIGYAAVSGHADVVQLLVNAGISLTEHYYTYIGHYLQYNHLTTFDTNAIRMSAILAPISTLTIQICIVQKYHLMLRYLLVSHSLPHLSDQDMVILCLRRVTEPNFIACNILLEIRKHASHAKVAIAQLMNQIAQINSSITNDELYTYSPLFSLLYASDLSSTPTIRDLVLAAHEVRHATCHNCLSRYLCVDVIDFVVIPFLG